MVIYTLKIEICKNILLRIPLLVFDIHGVLVIYDKVGFIWFIIKNLGALRFLFYKGVMEHLKDTLRKKLSTPESYFLNLDKIAPGIKFYFSGFFDISNVYKPIPGMQELLENLNKVGYELYFFQISATSVTTNGRKMLCR